MRSITISFPDEQYDSVMNSLKNIPDVDISENEDIPEWHKKILDERLLDLDINPSNFISIDELEKNLIENGYL